MKFIKIQQTINNEYPEFKIFSVSKIGEGCDNKAYLINENWIFRFPKRPEIKENLKKEILLLPLIRKNLELDIPEFRYVSKENIFVGYKKLKGAFFKKDLFNSLSGKKQRTIFKQISGFLSAIHQFDLSKLHGIGLDVINYKENYREEHEKVKEIIYPHILQKFQQKITDHFNSYLDNEKNFSFSNSLLHNDFSLDHILFSQSKNKLTGIIDFGDIAIGDPDSDLLHLYEEAGKQFIEKLLKYYQSADSNELFKKLEFYRLAGMLQSLIYETEEQRKNEIKKGYRRLKKYLQKMY